MLQGNSKRRNRTRALERTHVLGQAKSKRKQSSDDQPQANKQVAAPIELGKLARRSFLAGMVVVASAGCQNMINRGQSPDDGVLLQLYDENSKGTKYVGDICGIWGLQFAKVEGIGLAVSLDGTGSNPKPSGQKDRLLRELESNRNIESPKKLLESKNTELVAMKGLLPPGIRKGETFDLEVIPLGGTDATSLEGGRLLQTRLAPMKRLGRGVKQGHVTALGRGRISVDAIFESRQDLSNQLHGVILGGGKALEDRPLGLTIRTDDYTTKTTTMMARAINARFTTVGDEGRTGVAEPKTDRAIELVVPTGYRHNVGRYLAVIKNIAYDEKAADRVNRMDELEQEMNDPSTAPLASIRLEGLGKDGIPALKRALRHHDFEIQFHAAQSLAYSGQADGVDILKKAAAEEPAFRWHAFTALASLDDISASVALADLMHVKSAETRYGAFRAMRAHSPQDPVIQGDWLAGDFFLHEITSNGEPMLHFSREKRPEIVVFDDKQTVSPDFLHVETGLTIRGNVNNTVTISVYGSGDEGIKKVCSNRVSDLVRTLGTMGFGYGRQLKMFRSAMKAGTLNSRLVVNAVPKLGRKYVASDIELPPEKSDKYVAGPLPELFRSGEEKSTSLPRVQESTVGSIDREIEAQSESRWSKMKDWFAGNNKK